MQERKWSGLLPISSFGSRHYRWCRDKKGCSQGCATTCMTEPARLRSGSMHAIEGFYCDRSFSVAARVVEFHHSSCKTLNLQFP